MQEFLDGLNLKSFDIGYAIERIGELVRNPYSNITAALLLFAAVVIVVLLIAISIIAVVSRPSKRKAADDEEEMLLLLALLADEEQAEAPVAAAAPAPAPSRGSAKRRPPRRKLHWATTLLLVVACVVAVIAAVGITSASPTVCLACHDTNPHAAVVKSGGIDPHKSVGCARCHEPSGWLGGVTIEVPGRAAHIINGLATDPKPSMYGRVVSSACERCHGDIKRTTTLDEERGIRMAHLQPLEARAQCTDCHTLATGVITNVTVGMAPCLRCHNGTDQPTDCAVCHTKDVSAASRSRTNPAKMTGRVLVPTPDCGACHDQAAQCDPCHGGIRMPHSKLFTAYGHARQGTEDLWNTGGKKCARCHTAQRRPCTRCHAFFPGHPKEWRELHGNGGSGPSCDGCHGERAYQVGRDFCKLCHGEPVAQ